MKARHALALTAAALLLCANAYNITPSGSRILPVAGSIAAGTELSLKKGDLIYSQPVGAAYEAVIGKDLNIEIAGRKMTLQAGQQLNLAIAEGKAAEANLQDRRAVFCAKPENNWNAAKGIANLATLGLFAASQRHSAQIQFCLVDSDRDRMLDKAFLAGTNRKEDQGLVDIDPTPVSVRANVPYSGESVARIRFAGRGGLTGNLLFDLEVVERSAPLPFSNGRHLASIKSLPATVTIFGATMTILAYDEATKQVTLRLESGFSPLEYSVKTTTQYIPIYIPG